MSVQAPAKPATKPAPQPKPLPKRNTIVHTSLNHSTKMFLGVIKGFDDSMGHPGLIPIRYLKTKIPDKDYRKVEAEMESIKTDTTMSIAEREEKIEVYQKFLRQENAKPAVETEDGKPEKPAQKKERELKGHVFMEDKLCIGGYYYKVKNVSFRDTPDLAQAAVDAMIAYFLRDCLAECHERGVKSLSVPIILSVADAYRDDVLIKGPFKQFLQAWLNDKPNKLFSQKMAPMRIDFTPPPFPKNIYNALDIEYFKVYTNYMKDKRKQQGANMKKRRQEAAGVTDEEASTTPAPKKAPSMTDEQRLESIKTSASLVHKIIVNFGLTKGNITIDSQVKRLFNDLNNHLMRILIELCVQVMCILKVVTLKNENFRRVLILYFSCLTPNYHGEFSKYVSDAVEKMMSYINDKNTKE